MSYTYLELLSFLLIYGFFGWLIEVLVILASGSRFTNRGFFNLPICLEYGIMVDILLIILSPSGETLSLSNFLLQFSLAFVVVAAADYLSSFITAHIWHRHIDKFGNSNIFTGRLHDFSITLTQTLLVLVTIKLLHPFVYLVLRLIPLIVLKITVISLLIALLLDLAVTLYSAHHCRCVDDLDALRLRRGQRKTVSQGRLIHRISRLVWKRMHHAYPQLSSTEDFASLRPVFAEGLCLDKLFWIFIITAFAGDLIETLYCRMVAGIWMSRTSVLYGTFSIVWGFGGVLITILTQHLRHREDRYIFLTGMFLGGAYEYSCSVLSEYAFGTTFWDYSDMPFNIGGRTNLLFCLFWGLIAVFWVKLCFPALNDLIERFHPVYGKILTWGIVLLMAADLLLSAAALTRYVQRTSGEAPTSDIALFIDHTFPDDFIEKIWPNMLIVEQ